MSNTENKKVCPNCGEENPVTASVCDSCGVDLGGKKQNSNDTKGNNAKRGGNKQNNQQINTKQILIIIILMVVASLAVLIGSGTFDEPAPSFTQQTDEHNHSTDPHGGVNMNNLQKINELQQAYETNPDNNQALIDLAHLLNDSGFYEKAVQRYKEYLAKIPNEPDVWVDMGVCYYEMQNYDQAITTMKKALELKGDHQIAHFNLGIVYMASGSMDQAKEWWQKAVKLNPNTNIGKKAQDLLNSN